MITHKVFKSEKLSLKILWNYVILLMCIVGFHGGAIIALTLPAFQLGLSCFNYHHSKKWQTVLMSEIHLLISTVLGLYLEGYLYLRYISDDVESILVFQEILKIGFVLVCGMGIITTLLKYLTTKAGSQKNK